jgi:hypothetical protein
MSTWNATQVEGLGFGEGEGEVQSVTTMLEDERIVRNCADELMFTVDDILTAIHCCCLALMWR